MQVFCVAFLGRLCMYVKKIRLTGSPDTMPSDYPHLAAFLMCAFLFFAPGCGPGWDGYSDEYSKVVPVSAGPWKGDESVYVVLEDTKVEVALEGLDTQDFKGAPAVLLSDLIIKSGIISEPSTYHYDFTATDGYDLFIKRHKDVSLLPSWDEMTTGYLYLDSRYDDLTCGWTEEPWGSALSAYQVKWMNGGTITPML